MGPDQCGSVDWVLSCKVKGFWFDSQLDCTRLGCGFGFQSGHVERQLI